MAKVETSFIYNGYSVKVISDDIADVEIDVVEVRTALHKLPPAITIKPDNVQIVTGSASGAQPLPETQPEAKPAYEVVTVTEVKKDKTKGGKPCWKIFGGKYQTFGVVMYEDSCRFNDGLAAGNFHIRVGEGIEALVQKVDGAQRVTALRLASHNA